MNALLIIAAVLAVLLMAVYANQLGANLRNGPAATDAELTSSEAHAIAAELKSSGNARTVAAVIRLRAEH